MNVTRVEFDSRADARTFRAVALLAAGLSYWHAREFFTTVMDPVSASVTPLLLDLVVYWLADAYVTQARAGRPLGLLRTGAYGLMAASVGFNMAGAHTIEGAAGRALAPALFAFFVIVRVRLALADRRAEHGADGGRLPVRLWLRHPVRTGQAWLWLARQHSPAFDTARDERDRLRAVADAVRVALPGRGHRGTRRVILRSLTAGRLPAAEAVRASGLLYRDDVAELHRAALVADLGATAASTDSSGTVPAGQAPPARPPLVATVDEVAAVVGADAPEAPPPVPTPAEQQDTPPERRKALTGRQTPGIGRVRRVKGRRTRSELQQAATAFLDANPGASARALATGIGTRWETARDLLTDLHAAPPSPSAAAREGGTAEAEDGREVA